MKKSEIFQNTIDAWLSKDIDLFLSVLSDEISYTECYGPQYKGKKECEQWFRDWTAPAENKVKSWTVKSDYFDENTGFFTWTFHCVYKGKEELFDGISLVTFTGNLISEIQEFEQKHDKYRSYAD